MNGIGMLGHRALGWIQIVGLLIIALATVFAMGLEISAMIAKMSVSLADLLLLFIYLEVLEMVAIYLESGKLPIRIPLYIAIVALARYLILDMKNLDTWRMLGVTAAILLTAFSVLIIRFGHNRFPYDKHEKNTN